MARPENILIIAASGFFAGNVLFLQPDEQKMHRYKKHRSVKMSAQC